MLSDRGFKNFAARCKKLARQTRRLVPDARSYFEGPKSILVRNLSQAFFVEVMSNISNGKYPNNNYQYNADYLDWKLRNYGHLEKWHLAGDLVRNITVFIKDGERGVGVRPGKKVGGKSWFKNNQSKSYNPREIAKYGQDVENRMPVFGPTMIDFIDGKAKKLTQDASHRVLKKWEIR